MAVGVAERARHLAGDAQGVLERQRALALEPVPQRFPFDVGHHVVEGPARLTRIVQRQDVGVGEPGGQLDFPEEPLGAERGGDLGAEHLDGDGAAVPEIAREVHGGHAAVSQLALEGVAVGQRRAQGVERRTQRRGSALNRCKAARASRT